uniref:Uncharacterized protein n=1 Tax=Heterorhabditis bacteriophora TaxID=37862 RepID=A0A1I7XP07_HETBA
MSGRAVVPIDRGFSVRSRPSGGIYAASSSIPSQLLSSDGFGSPRDSAHTPPGVIVKMDTLTRTRTSIRSEYLLHFCMTLNSY